MSDRYLRIRFCDGIGWDSKCIERYERSPWSHVELLLEDGQNTFGAQFWGGVRTRSVHDKCYKLEAMYEVWEIPLTEEEYVWLGVLMDQVDHLPYDWRAIVAFALGERWHRRKYTYICSGVVMFFLAKLRKVITVRREEEYDPSDVYMLVPNIKGARKVHPYEVPKDPRSH